MSTELERPLQILRSDELLEKLAAIEHERWAHWQAYLHEQCGKGRGGELIIPAELASRWTVQLNTPYEELPEEEHQSDRDQVQRYLPIIIDALQNQE